MNKKILLFTSWFQCRTGLLLILIFLLQGFSFAQIRTVTGIVSASDTKETLPGAAILIKGTTTGTTSDINGKYSINVPQGKVILIFSFMGYTSRDVEVGNQTTIDIFLEPSRVSLEEVVVIGYGTVRKSDLTGAVSSIKSDDLTKITALDPVQSLQGKIAGVQVSSPSGVPGVSPIVRIRGVGTINNTSPIYVVDGVILDDISFLNSADIKSMEVLKDASATAIYGSRGANGVIMVTTKSGYAGGGKTIFNLTSEFSVQNIAKKINLLTGRDFAIISNEIKTGSFNNVDAVPSTDWQKLIFHIAPIYNIQLSASGSSKTIQYYLGIGYFNQEGIIDKSNYQRITVKVDDIYNLTDFLRFGNNLTFSPYKQQLSPDVVYQAYRAWPTDVPYYPDGSYAAVGNIGNPLASLAYSNNSNTGIKAVGNFFGELDFLKSFTLRSSFGIDALYNKSQNFTPAYTVLNPDGTASHQYNEMSSLTKLNTENLTWLWENTLSYKKEFGKHYVDALIGYTMQNTTSSLFGITGSNIIRDTKNFWYINPNNIYDPSNSVNNIKTITDHVDPAQYYSMISYLFRVNYTFNKRYILTATFRRDGSSKFSQSNRYGNFPSFAVGWNISQEKFMKKVGFLNTLKIRASWGKIGNEKISYWDRYSKVENISAILGNPSATNAAGSYSLLGNPNLKWETTTQTDIGLETGFLKDRLTGEFDYYNKVTDDMLVGLGIPGYFGNGQGQKETFNAGSMLNRGFEFNVNWKDAVGKLKYNIGFNGTYIHNELRKIGGASGSDSVLLGGFLGNGLPVTRSVVGLPVGAFYGYKTDGVFQSQQELDAYPHDKQAGVGDLRFVDMNGDGKIDAKDRTYLGSPIPTFMYGFNISLEYAGFDFSFNIQGQTGNKIYNAKEMIRPDPYNFEQHVMGRWTSPGSSYTEPRPSFGGYNYNISDKFIQDGSFVRIRNVILGYTLPASISKKIVMQKIRLYIKADNLYTFAKFTGYSPEIGSSDVLSANIDNGIYPITAVYSIGLNLTF